MAQDPRQAFGRNAAFYATSQSHTEEQSLRALADLAGAGPGQMALDVATGTGHTAATLARAGDRVVAIDLTPEMLAQAQRLYPGLGVDWVLGDVMRLPFMDGTFDLVVSRRAPHHFPDIEGALRSMRGALRPGGSMVIDDRSVPEDEFADITMNLLDKLHDRSHVRERPLSEWSALLESVGLEVVRADRYERRRPLDSLTATAEEEDAQEIREVVDALDEEGRARMGIEVVAGEIVVTHWFVMIKALRPMPATL